LAHSLLLLPPLLLLPLLLLDAAPHAARDTAHAGSEVQ
jgi:hypothetical protein